MSDCGTCVCTHCGGEWCIGDDALGESHHAAEVARLKGEVSAARQQNERTYCAYCGDEFALDNDAAVLVGEHIAVCDKHPMRDVEAQRDTARTIARDAVGLVKAFHEWVGREDMTEDFDLVFKMPDTIAALVARLEELG